MNRGTPDSLKKYTSLEWKVPMSGGQSEKFLLQNQECYFYFSKMENRKIRKECYSLHIQSKSKIPLSFEVDVRTFTDENGSKIGFSTIDTEGFAPYISHRGTSYLIWSEITQRARGLAKGGIFSFIVTFLNVSDIKLMEDANAKTEVGPQTSRSANQELSLKKMTCLMWVCERVLPPVWGPPYCYCHKTSPKFVIGRQACSFACIRNTDSGKDQVQFTLAINPEPDNLYDEDIARNFDVTVHVDWGNKNSTFEGTETVEHIPNNELWISQLKNLFSDIGSFRLYFPSNLNTKLIQDADGKTKTGSEEGPSTSKQFTQTSSFLDSEYRLRSLSSDLRKLLSDDSGPDTTIQCGRCPIPAHRIILATRSDVLKAMLQTNEARLSVPRVLQIEDMQPSVCEKFIEYLYTASVTDLSVQLALSLHEAGKKYAVASLRRWCYDFLREKLSTGNLPRDIDDILTSSEWNCFCKREPKLAVEVLQRALYKKKKKF